RIGELQGLYSLLECSARGLDLTLVQATGPFTNISHRAAERSGKFVRSRGARAVPQSVIYVSHEFQAVVTYEEPRYQVPPREHPLTERQRYFFGSTNVGQQGFPLGEVGVACL